MTSSLVGSEMCIRDSASGTLKFECEVYKSCGRQQAMYLHMPKGQNHHARAVSYTHLTLPTICSV
eukprot:4225727-Prorocentrum_lima.AAC.1